jgi:hypothetical protein
MTKRHRMGVKPWIGQDLQHVARVAIGEYRRCRETK